MRCIGNYQALTFVILSYKHLSKPIISSLVHISMNTICCVIYKPLSVKFTLNQTKCTINTHIFAVKNPDFYLNEVCSFIKLLPALSNLHKRSYSSIYGPKSL